MTGFSGPSRILPAVLRWWDVVFICQMAPLMPGFLACVVGRFRRELEFWVHRAGAGGTGNSSQLELF